MTRGINTNPDGEHLSYNQFNKDPGILIVADTLHHSDSDKQSIAKHEVWLHMGIL